MIRDIVRIGGEDGEPSRFTDSLAKNAGPVN